MSATPEQLAQAQHSEPEPPAAGEDRSRWRPVYRGRGHRRQVGAVVEVTLTPDQKAWLDRVADDQQLTLSEAVSNAIELARQNDARALSGTVTK